MGGYSTSCLALPFCCHTRLPKWRLKSRNEKGKLHSSQAYLSATLQAAILHFCTTTHNPPSPFSWLHGWPHWLHPCNVLCRFSQVARELEFSQQKQQRGIKKMLRRRIAYIWMLWARWIRFRKNNASHRLYPGVCLVVCLLPLVMSGLGLFIRLQGWRRFLKRATQALSSRSMGGTACRWNYWQGSWSWEVFCGPSHPQDVSKPELAFNFGWFWSSGGTRAAGLMVAFGMLAVRALD